MKTTDKKHEGTTGPLNLLSIFLPKLPWDSFALWTVVPFFKKMVKPRGSMILKSMDGF